MRLGITSVCLTALMLIVSGCSKKKEEAAKLQQEMQGTTTSVDSAALAESTMVAADTTMAANPEAIPEETPEIGMPPRPVGAGYTVQVAGCESRDYAEHLVQLYTQRGYEPYLTTITKDGQTYYRVRIGNFAEMSEANALLSELKDKYSVTGWIDRIEQ